MNAQEIHARLAAQFPADVGPLVTESCDPYAVVTRTRIKDACRFLRDQPDLAFDSLRCLSGVDWKDRVTVVYHLLSVKLRHTFVLKVDEVRDNPLIDSVADVWSSANWFEREVFDLLGIRFNGHPNLARLMLPQDWVGHPLRKDYVEQADYHGIATTRPDLLGDQDA